MPKISVCVLAYNHAKLMRRSLDNLLEQTFHDFEMIISDDCSPDPDMEPLCREFVQRDSRVQYFRNPRNLGRIQNYNAAVSHATGEYVAVVHDGDRYKSNLLEKWAEALDTYPSAAFVFTTMEAIDWEGNHVKYCYHDFPPLIKGKDLVDIMLYRMDSPVFGMTMFRRSCYEQVGPFDERYDIIGDVDMWMRLAINFDVAYIRDSLIGRIPREENHDTVMRLWDEFHQNWDLHRVNAERRYIDRPEELARALSRIDAMFQRQLARQLLSCFRRKQGKLLREGIKYTRAVPKIKLHLLATALDLASRAYVPR